MRKRIYIAHPISKGNLAEILDDAIDTYVKLLKSGYAPFCPGLSAFSGGIRGGVAIPEIGLNVPFAIAERMPEGTVHQDWMDIDLPWVAVSHAVIRRPGESKGADEEVALATSLGTPVFYSLDELYEKMPSDWIRESKNLPLGAFEHE